VNPKKKVFIEKNRETKAWIRRRGGGGGGVRVGGVGGVWGCERGVCSGGGGGVGAGGVLVGGVSVARGRGGLGGGGWGPRAPLTLDFGRRLGLTVEVFYGQTPRGGSVASGGGGARVALVETWGVGAVGVGRAQALGSAEVGFCGWRASAHGLDWGGG